METVKKQAPKILLKRQTLAIALMAIGLCVTIFYGMRAVKSYRQLQFIREQGLDRGVASIEAIRPWMTVRYVSVAYAVPEEYIFAQLDISFNRRNSNDTLGHLNRMYQLGKSAKGDYPVIVDTVANAILDYRENPVVTGLDDIRPWMTIRYIANSTGVSEEYLLEQLGLGAEDDYVARPLDHLADLTDYEGGRRGLIEAIKAALAQYEGEQQ